MSLGGLRHRYRVAILLKDLCDGFPAGAIGNAPCTKTTFLMPAGGVDAAAATF